MKLPDNDTIHMCTLKPYKHTGSASEGGRPGERVCAFLDDMHIRYEVTEHPAVHDMAALRALQLPHPDCVAKNLFVRDDKRRNYYLITVKGDKRADLKALRRRCGTRPLSMAGEEELGRILGLAPGAVTPFGVLNDAERRTHVFLDEDFLQPPALIGIHPNENTATLWLRTEDLLRILAWHGTPADTLPL